MSHQVGLIWGGGEHTFALTIGGLRALQDACNAGPQEVLMRLVNGTWRVDDPLAILRHGLIGGGMAKDAARDLVNRTAESDGLMAMVTPAQLVLSAALVGVEDDRVGEPMGEAEPPVNGVSATSMDPVPLPDLPPATLTE